MRQLSLWLLRAGAILIAIDVLLALWLVRRGAHESDQTSAVLWTTYSALLYSGWVLLPVGGILWARWANRVALLRWGIGMFCGSAAVMLVAPNEHVVSLFFLAPAASVALLAAVFIVVGAFKVEKGKPAS